MSDYVLVHGGNMPTDAWNKIVKREEYPSGEYMGGKIWNKLVLELKSHNHQVFAPTLLDANKYNLSDHINQICEVIKENNLKNVILIGYSYGGMIITGVANKMKEKISLLVYLDAALPESGQSLYDILLFAKYEPKPVLENFPKAYTEKIYFDPEKLKLISKIYVQCTESSFLLVTKLIINKISKQKNWQIFKLNTTHIPQATIPDELINLILRFSKCS